MKKNITFFINITAVHYFSPVTATNPSAEGSYGTVRHRSGHSVPCLVTGTFGLPRLRVPKHSVVIRLSNWGMNLNIAIKVCSHVGYDLIKDVLSSCRGAVSSWLKSPSITKAASG